MVDALVVEIGSTTTVVSAFDGLGEGAEGTPVGGGGARREPRLLGQGTAMTSVTAGDVTLGAAEARTHLEELTGPMAPRWVLATSSAAGGLRMTVHGLTERMTARAAREAALGAGAVVKYQTAGRMREGDLRRVVAAAPGLILLAGGVEGGDVGTVLWNAARLAETEDWPGARKPIVVYGGNSAVKVEVREILEAAGFRVRITTNVYPAVDELDILPARAAIHDAFEEHITHAPGMERIGEMVNGPILPTPGAVLLAAERLAEAIGDLLVIDVGGATTDVHSITDGSPEIAPLQTEPQPHSRRTVEGDLGTYVSAQHVATLLDARERPEALPPALPGNPGQVAAARRLARVAALTAVQRHAGRLSYVYTPTGRKTVARGRDLSACRWVIGTGGALTRLPGGLEILEEIGACRGGDLLLPPPDARCLLDGDYIFAACGTLLGVFGCECVVALMRRSLGV